jgi:hypothetical protein
MAKFVLFLVLSLVFSACINEVREKQLLEKIADLESRLDECENGADKIHARIELAFKEEKYDTCETLYLSMKNRHPDSELFPEVEKTYHKAVLKVEEREEKARREREKARREREKARRERLASLRRLKKEHDDVQNITWYYQPYFRHYDNINRVSLYIGEQNGQAWLRMRMSYAGDGWIFFDKAYLSYEGNTWQVFFDDYREKKSDHDAGRVWEWIDVQVPAERMDFLKEFAQSTEAKMRFSGKYSKTRKLTRNERRGIADVLTGYEVLLEELATSKEIE